MEDWMWFVLTIPLLALVLLLGANVAVAHQARQRGYAAWLWFVAGLIAINPVIFLVVLALMPNRKRQRLRQQFRAELDAKLAARPASQLTPAPATAPSSLSGSTVTGERSLGDMPTVAPPERSLGDEETRG